MKQLTEQQAYLAMYSFLEQQYQLGAGNELGALLGNLSLLPDGSSADPACKQDWASAVDAAIGGRVNANLTLRK
jgi:hypothetical protein